MVCLSYKVIDMPSNRDFTPVIISGDTEVDLLGAHDVRIVDAASAPRLVGLIGGMDGTEIAIHNLSGVDIPIINDAGSPTRKILTTGLGGDFVLPHGQIVWAIQVDPNDVGFSDGARGWYLDSGGHEVFARAKATGSTPGPTQSSSTPAVLEEMSLSITTVGGELLIGFSSTFDVHNGDEGTYQLYLDGDPYETPRKVAYAGGSEIGGAPYGLGTLVVGLSPGGHTVDVRWSATAGSLRAVGTQRVLFAMEI